MAAKSPTVSVKSREMIGVEQFSQRREVFDKPDAEYVPLPSPTSPVPTYREVEPIITSNHGKTTSNFKRNTPGYSSMRESRTDERQFDFRPRKYSDNFTSELNQSDDVDYRHSMTERTRRLSKMRRDFMTSNLYEPGSSPIQRGGTRSSMPTNSTSPIKYKIESPNLYKFPFAEPYLTPTPVRRVILSLDSEHVDGKENEDPQNEKYNTLPNNHSYTKIDHQKLYEELVKRYSPQRKPIDWKLPPTRPKVIGSVPKSSSSIGSDEKRDEEKPEDDDVFEKKHNNTGEANKNVESEILQNGPGLLSDETAKKEENESDSKLSQPELDEKNDRVPELGTIQRQLSRESAKKPLVEIIDLTIPDLIEKMTAEGEDLENHKKTPKKVKRKRSFLDKLLGRNKDK
ncbi:uncharacterized protein LOC119191159 [Manduca sexta]|uniref:uncharacterized protein LOC119191159 n=1 Tax=Manduca sexta TaxID=7130 RepID=UPI00188E205B|nr:uncharacterized protein LOC119191159 [Manduca sexta]